MSAGVCSEELIRTADLRVDYFYPATGRQRHLACVFSPFGSLGLEGNPYGGDLLLNHGYDVISFKTMASQWYQNVPSSLLDRIATDPRFTGYEERIGYGSSMGAYAAIAFSSRLAFDRVFAFSPQYSIREDFDRRWVQHAGQIDWRYTIDPAALAKECVFHFVYDDKDADRLHVQRIKSLSSRATVRETRLPYSGHPTFHFLYEAGLLKEFTLGLVSGRGVSREALRHKRRLSATYYRQLAEHALARDRDATALKLVASGLKLRAEDPALLKLKARVLERSGQIAAAIETLQVLARTQAEDVQAWAALGVMQLKSGDLAGLQAVDRAFALKRAAKNPA